MEDLPAHLLPLYEARKFSILFEELQVLHPTKSISQISDCIQHLKSQFFSSFDTSFRDSIVASIRQSLPDDLRNSSSVNRAWNQRNGNHLLAETNEEELTLLQESLPPTSVKLKFSLQHVEFWQGRVLRQFLCSVNQLELEHLGAQCLLPSCKRVLGAANCKFYRHQAVL